MGFHISWLAVRGKAENVVRKELGLIEAGQREFVPEAAIQGLDLGSGWYLLYFNSPGFPPRVEHAIPDVSRGAELVACVIDEYSMLSLAFGYSNGKSMWHVLHNAQKGKRHLETSGMLPAPYHAMRVEQLAKQVAESRKTDNIFDVPVMLAHELTGYRHDQGRTRDEGQTPYVVLRRRGLLDDGYISWVAVRARAADVVLAKLGIADTGERQEIPQAELLGLALESGWYLLLQNSWRADCWIESEILRLSRDSELVSCSVDGVRRLAIGFAGGKCTWRVLNDRRYGPTHLEETGALPDIYTEIRRRQVSKYAETWSSGHISEIPVMLAHVLTGYRHDSPDGRVGTMSFAVLKLPSSA